MRNIYYTFRHTRYSRSVADPSMDRIPRLPICVYHWPTSCLDYVDSL